MPWGPGLNHIPKKKAHGIKIMAVSRRGMTSCNNAPSEENASLPIVRAYTFEQEIAGRFEDDICNLKLRSVILIFMVLRHYILHRLSQPNCNRSSSSLVL